MKKANWREIAELIGIAAIVASLIFVGIQLRQDEQIAQAERLATQQILDLEITRFIDERAEVWRKGLAGEEQSENDQISFEMISYALFRQQANEYRTRFFLSGVSAELAVRTYAFFLYQNPGARAWFDKLVESRVSVDRAYGLPGEIIFFPKIVNDQLRYLDDHGPQEVDSYYLPY